jgi:hypothetical protein
LDNNNLKHCYNGLNFFPKEGQFKHNAGTGMLLTAMPAFYQEII